MHRGLLHRVGRATVGGVHNDRGRDSAEVGNGGGSHGSSSAGIEAATRHGHRESNWQARGTNSNDDLSVGGGADGQQARHRAQGLAGQGQGLGLRGAHNGQNVRVEGADWSSWHIVQWHRGVGPVRPAIGGAQDLAVGRQVRCKRGGDRRRRGNGGRAGQRSCCKGSNGQWHESTSSEAQVLGGAEHGGQVGNDAIGQAVGGRVHQGGPKGEDASSVRRGGELRVGNLNRLVRRNGRQRRETRHRVPGHATVDGRQNARDLLIGGAGGTRGDGTGDGSAGGRQANSNTKGLGRECNTSHAASKKAVELGAGIGNNSGSQVGCSVAWLAKDAHHSGGEVIRI